MNSPYGKQQLTVSRKSRSNIGHALNVIAMFPVFVGWIVWDYFTAWITSRHGMAKALLLGLPALIGLIVGGNGLFYALVLGQSETITARYLGASQSAVGRQQPEVAWPLMRRLIRDGEASDQEIYLAAYVAEELNLRAAHEALLDHLIGEVGYGPALVMRAQTLLKSPIPSEADEKKSEDFLRQALASDPDLAQAHGILAQILLSRGDEEGAIPHLEKAATAFPEMGLSLADLYLKRDAEAESMRWGTQAASTLEAQRDRAEPGSQQFILASLAHAQAQAFAKQFSSAASVLQDRFEVRSHPSATKAGAVVYALWARELLKPENREQGRIEIHQQAIRLLEEAFRLSPGEPQTIAILARLCGFASEKWALSNSLAAELLGRGESPWLLHWIRGVQTLKMPGGSLKETNPHWERASALSPNCASLLARVVEWACQEDQCEPDEGLRLLDLLLKTNDDPETVFLLEQTKGQVLMVKEDWESAIVAFKAAIALGEDSFALHASLARAYEKLGNHKDAVSHRRKAEVLIQTKG